MEKKVFIRKFPEASEDGKIIETASIKKTVVLTPKQENKRREESEAWVKEKEKTEYIHKRNAARGSVATQLEYIVENGIEAFIARDNEIRDRHPKPSNE